MSSSVHRWPALDGIRGIAILLVLGYHLPWGAFRVGSYGVVVFFVLSGFLITTILLREIGARGKANLVRFYARRARRLLPALVLVSLGHLILQLTVLGQPEEWWGRTWPVLAYVSNLVQISGTSLVHMGHTWSLAVEEHFYLIWPVVFVMTPARRRLAVTALSALLLLAWRLILLLSSAPNLRISFGTDTNAFALLVGCLMAVALYEGRWPRTFRHASAVSVSLLVAISCLPIHYTDRLVLWGTVPVALLAAFAIHAAIEQPASWLEVAWLRWFGVISYGLYLWHYMLISLPWDRFPLPAMPFMVGISVTVAWMSWRFVEAPILGSNWRPGRLEQLPRPVGEVSA